MLLYLAIERVVVVEVVLRKVGVEGAKAFAEDKSATRKAIEVFILIQSWVWK